MMDDRCAWDVLYGASEPPSWEEIASYIGNPLWEELNRWLGDSYGVAPVLSYSGCAAQRGWNIKYKKGGRALCTLYPEKGFFIALVVIGGKEEAAVEAMLPVFTPYTESLYKNTRGMPMGRWLMIRVTDGRVLKDVKTLINIRVKPKAEKA